MSESIDVELCFRIWNDGGFRYEVDEDGDGLDMVRVSYFEKSERKQDLTFDVKNAREVAAAILKVADHIEQRSKVHQ